MPRRAPSPRSQLSKQDQSSEGQQGQQCGHVHVAELFARDRAHGLAHVGIDAVSRLARPQPAPEVTPKRACALPDLAWGPLPTVLQKVDADHEDRDL